MNLTTKMLEISTWTKYKRIYVNKKVQLDATVCRHLFTAKSLHVLGVTAPIIRSTKNCNCYLWYRSYCKVQIKN